MENKSISMNDRLYQYLLSVSLRENESLRLLREETAKDPMAILQIPPDQGQFMALLVKLMGAKRILEIGTYTGYSTLSMALALPDDGTIISCDINQSWADIGRPYWRQAGVENQIDLRIAPALKTMSELLESGGRGSFDLIFIDADKGSYSAYYEKGMDLLRDGGLFLLDNVLWKGRVADESILDPDTTALRELNELIYRDLRVDVTMLPTGDGLTLARKL